MPRRSQRNPRVVNVILLFDYARTYMQPANQSFFKEDNVVLDWIATDV